MKTKTLLAIILLLLPTISTRADDLDTKLISVGEFIHFRIAEDGKVWDFFVRACAIDAVVVQPNPREEKHFEVRLATRLITSSSNGGSQSQSYTIDCATRAEADRTAAAIVGACKDRGGKQSAEQAGTDQPATKPADESPVKGQPSTPTPKGGPR